VATTEVHLADEHGVRGLHKFLRWPSPPPPPPEPPAKPLTAEELERERAGEYLRVRGFGHVIDDPELLRALRGIILEGAPK
jgi:hypothetical protein